jgi:hypothetical protein
LHGALGALDGRFRAGVGIQRLGRIASLGLQKWLPRPPDDRHHALAAAEDEQPLPRL